MIFRLSYPADIYASVEAGTLEEAKAKMAGVLHTILPGVDLKLDEPAAEGRLYPRADHNGAIDRVIIAVEDIEEE
jgi:hypothetical protein